MPTRILDVRDAQGDPYPLAGQGVHADARLAVDAAITATATPTRATGSSLAVAATVTAAATSARAAAASSTVTATITAGATVAAPTSLTSTLTAATSTYGTGTLVVPGYDQAYTLTLSNAALTTYPTYRTYGIKVTLPEPSTPNATHWLTITYTVSDLDRRFFHDLRTRWRIDGTVTEPNPTAGQTTTIGYTWDTTAHEWYVSSTTGSPTVRTHGPNENSGDLPLYFTPECRAMGSFSTIKADHLTALAAVPSTTQAALADAGQVIDVTSDASGYLFETMTAREIFDPTWDSGITGRYYDPTVNAYPWMSGNPANGRTMLHELGHAWDKFGLTGAGTPYGVDPRDYYSPNAYDSITYTGDPFDYYGITIVAMRYDFEPTRYMYTFIDGDDNEYPSSWLTREPANFHDEQPIVDLYATVPDKPGSYYRSTITEWTAQCFMLAWAEHVSGYNVTDWNTRVAEVGGSSIFADFVAYAVSVDVLPSSW